MASFFFGLVSLALYPCALLGLGMRFLLSLICGSRPAGRVVGIFSRSAPKDYEWLTQALNSALFDPHVKESRSVCISNREGQRFREAVHQCDVTILYHTKNHGRINITNVMDSLYDEELQYMSSCKGRGNVIVMVDDLEKGDDEEKRRILHFQHDIPKYAQDLILVTGNEKRQPQLLDRKLQHLRALVCAGSGSSGGFWNYLVSMTGWVQSNVSRGGGGGSSELDAPLLA